ncbi:MAG: hypothetical protein ACPGO3_00210 [Magnetospiraceae bacterium]
MDEIELRKELAMLRAKSDANKWLMIGLAVELVRAQAIAPNDLLKSLMAATVLAGATDKRVGPIMAGSVGILEALFRDLDETPRPDPRRVMVTQAIMSIDAGPERQRALHSWLQQATPDEVAQEIQDLFQLTLGQNESDPDGSPP